MTDKKFNIILAVSLAAAILLLFLSAGCSLFPQHTDPIPDNPTDIIYRTVEKTNWLVTLSILGVGAGFFAFLNGGSKGAQVMAACLVVLCLTLGIMRYATWIAFFGAAGAIGMVAYTAYIKNRALKEIIAGGETLKANACTPEGGNAVMRFHSAQRETQSPATKKIVDAIQKKV